MDRMMHPVEYAMWNRLRSCINSRIVSGAVLAIAVTGTHGQAHAQECDQKNGCCNHPGSPLCQLLQPAPPPRYYWWPYQQFLYLAGNSGIQIGQLTAYSEQYFLRRGQLFCSLLWQGEAEKIADEVKYPPVLGWTVTTPDRQWLEVAIMRVAAFNYCPSNWPLEQQWEATYVQAVQAAPP
jgi:hypothetical protein